MMGGENDGFTGKDKKVNTRKPTVTNRENSSNLLRAQPISETGLVNLDKKLGMIRDGLSGNGGILRQVSRVRISLAMRSKLEARELRRKLEEEQVMVRNLMRKIDTNDPRMFDNLDKDHVGPPRMSKPLNQLTASVFENTKCGSENVEKDKRAPKDKPLPMNREIIRAKVDKLPLSKQGSRLGPTSGSVKFPNHVLKKCKALLVKLMRNKNGWVFLKPVDVERLGLHDYFDIIKYPMDLGTVKERLAKNYYSTPLEFAEDVRLTFQNAMTYNPKGHDVHIMAQGLLKLFEVNWAPLEAEYKRDFKSATDFDVGLPTAREAPPQPRKQPDMEKVIDKTQKPKNIIQSGEISVQKEPKEDPNGREMTYEEKQKLSVKLQNLPTEELETVVEIIKNNTNSLTQDNDEIEIDIDTVDAGTLWELDRLVNDYLKSSSKDNKTEKVPSSIAAETPKGSRADVGRVVSARGNNVNQEASQSSSDTDSGSSSSSDSDGETSGDGSDGERSPNVEICGSD